MSLKPLTRENVVVILDAIGAQKRAEHYERGKVVLAFLIKRLLSVQHTLWDHVKMDILVDEKGRQLVSVGVDDELLAPTATLLVAELSDELREAIEDSIPASNSSLLARASWLTSKLGQMPIGNLPMLHIFCPTPMTRNRRAENFSS